MHGSLTYRALLRDLADQLMLEYSGALPPGQVLGLVYRANSTVTRVSLESRLSTVGAIVRRLLPDRLALEGQAGPATRRLGTLVPRVRDLGPYLPGRVRQILES